MRFSLFDHADIGTRAKEMGEGRGEGRGFPLALSSPLPLSFQFFRSVPIGHFHDGVI